MSIDVRDPRMRCRMQPGRAGETRVIIEMPTEPAYMRRVMAAISDLTLNRFDTDTEPAITDVVGTSFHSTETKGGAAVAA